ncbi:uncharacterized protein TNCV_1368171 [Trichonephila clavipes]|nr:uncharacterized protein TNCV_1368171 [Trichonephila clavipes]
MLCIWNNGFTLTNGVVSYGMDRECPNELFKFLHYLNSTIDLCHRPTLVSQHSWLATDDSTHILFKSIKEDSSRRFTSVDASLQCTMDQIDAFPEHISTTVVPVTLPEKPDALEYAALQGQVQACINYQEPNAKRVFVLFCKDNWYQKKDAGG